MLDDYDQRRGEEACLVFGDLLFFPKLTGRRVTITFIRAWSLRTTFCEARAELYLLHCTEKKGGGTGESLHVVLFRK